MTDIGLIHTKVRGRENEIISTPNSTFTNSTLVNYSTRQSRVLRMTFGLSQPSGITELLKITRDIQASLESCDYVEKLNQPPRANLKVSGIRSPSYVSTRAGPSANSLSLSFSLCLSVFALSIGGFWTDRTSVFDALRLRYLRW